METHLPSQHLDGQSKVVRYLGSSSGYYLMGDIMTKAERKSIEGIKVSVVKGEGESVDGVFTFPTDQGTVHLRKMNGYDDDMLMTRNATDAEHAIQVALDEENTSDKIAPRSLIVALVHRLCCDSIFKDAGVEQSVVMKAFLENSSELVRKEFLTPRLPTIQAFILLCAFPSHSTESYRIWIRAGMAVRMAQELGLHRALTVFSLPRKRMELYKRICIFVNFIKLSSILGEVLRRIYSPKAKSINLVESTIISTVQTLQQMLTEWFDQLPDNCKITSEDLIRLRQSPENTKKLTEGGPLMLCYYAITMLLHRNFILTENEESPISIQSDSVRRCKEAAARVIDIACIIPRMDIVNFGWNFAVFSVFQATLIHIYYSTSEDSVVAEEARTYMRRGIDQCITPLSELMLHEPHTKHMVDALVRMMANGQTLTKEGEPKNSKSQNAIIADNDSSNPTTESNAYPSDLDTNSNNLTEDTTRRANNSQSENSTDVCASLLPCQYSLNNSGAHTNDRVGGFDWQCKISLIWEYKSTVLLHICSDFVLMCISVYVFVSFFFVCV
ncbi:hypothetical protein F4703DRAFT_1745667 [Phycomyces blakesleeanus]